jgi:DNA-directed RNA polymerase subunit M/transcription elongation factor TFIIS
MSGSNLSIKCLWMSAALLVALCVPVLGAEEPETGPVQDQCIACHLEDDNLPEDHVEDDIHLQAGLTCAGCHGGDPTTDDEDAAMSVDAGFIGVPSRAQIPVFCGKCHSDIDFMRQYSPRIATDQEDQYYTSVHGEQLLKGDTRVATCTSCHTAHAIFKAKDTRSTVHALQVPATCNNCHGDADYMADYGIRTDQYEQYAQGVHGVALLENQDTGAPACNDCHGNHGAVPPGAASVRQVCGSCHVNNMNYFSSSRMGQAFEEEELHGCEECHGNHNVPRTTDAMVGTGDEAVCLDCHGEGEKGYEAAEQIHEHLMSLVTAYDEAEEQREEVERIGMDDVDIGFVLQESHQSLIQARTLVHTFDPKKVGEKTEEGVALAKEASALAAAQVKDHRVRRNGLGMATLFITILVVALFLKIRELDGR